MELNEKLKMYRTNKGLSQEKLAEFLHVSRQAVTKWEAGQSTPSSENLIALAKLYDVSLDELIETKEIDKRKKRNSPKYNPILRANLIKIAIILQAASLNVAMQPIYTAEGTSLHFVFLTVKYVPLLASSIWMAFNLKYETDEKQFKKNTRIELFYCLIQLLVALFGYYTKLYFYAALMLIVVCSVYILLVNPKYMNRQLVRKK